MPKQTRRRTSRRKTKKMRGGWQKSSTRKCYAYPCVDGRMSHTCARDGYCSRCGCSQCY